MLNSYAFILSATGSWQGVWWVCLAIVVIGLLLTVFCIRIDHAEEMAMVAAGGDVKPWAGLTSLNSWLLVIVFACFAFIFSVWSAMAPTFLQTPLVGMDMAAANSVSSITTVTGIVGSLIIGVVLSKVKNQPLVLVGTMVLCTVAGIIQFIFTGQAMIIVVAVLVGLFTNIVPPALFSNAQWAAKTPAGVALVMAALPIGSNFGGIPAAPIAGAIVESTGSWAMAAAPLGHRGRHRPGVLHRVHGALRQVRRGVPEQVSPFRPARGGTSHRRVPAFLFPRLAKQAGPWRCDALAPADLRECGAQAA